MRKLLVANRSEIAIRCFRAATELGLRTVAIYSYEDRFSLHRFKADEAFLIGPAARRRAGALVSEHRRDHRRREGSRASTRFIPATDSSSESAGVRARVRGRRHRVRRPDARAARHLRRQDRRQAAGASLRAFRRFPGTEHALTDPPTKSSRRPQRDRLPADDQGELRRRRTRHARRARRRTSSQHKLDEAQREAGAAFGRADVFLERYIARAKHIEVQILGDAHGNLVHLWERDCSVQRRHQKVVEVAPSINSAGGAAAAHLRRGRPRCAGRCAIEAPAPWSSCSTSIAASSSSSRSTRASRSSTRSPRWSPASISCAARSWSPPATRCTSRRSSIPAQDEIERRGVAMQCRVTTEDPDRHFIPDYGRITTYRSAGGFAVRLDGGNGFGGCGHHAVLRFAARQGHDVGRARSRKPCSARIARCASSASAASRPTSRFCST